MARSLTQLFVVALAGALLIAGGCRYVQAEEALVFSQDCAVALHAVQGKATGAQAREISRKCASEAKAILAVASTAHPNAVLHQVDIGDAIMVIVPDTVDPKDGKRRGWVIGFSWK